MRYLLLLAAGILLIGCGKDDIAIRESNKYIARHQYDNARAVIEKALREDPKNAKLLRQQVRYFLCTEQAAFCATAYSKLQDISPRDNVLYQALTDDNPAIRITAVRAFSEIKNTDSLAALIKASEDKDKSVRYAVIQSLEKLGDKNSIPTLQKLLTDPDWFVRGNAALVLGKIGNADCVTALFKSLGDPDPYVHKSVRLSLLLLSTKENLSAYQLALNSDDSTTRSLAGIILATNGNVEANPVLITELKNPANPDLGEIIQILSKIKDPAALPDLRQIAVSNAANTIRIKAILALGEYQDKDSAEQLKGIQKDPKTDREVRTACVIALSKISKK